MTVNMLLLKLLFVTGLVIETNSAPRCKQFNDPTNGYVTCDSLFHLFCSPECHPGYRFVTKPAVVYMCGPVTGEWFTYPAGHMLPWPDCIPDDRNTRDDISRELAQTRQAITKQIMDNQQGIPTSPYASATSDPEDRFHHLYDYIEKAQKAYQFRHAIEQEAQALKNENHGNNNNLKPTTMMAQTALGKMQTQTSPAGLRSNIYHNYLQPTGLQAQTTRVTLPQATQNYQQPTRFQHLTYHNYPAVTGVQTQTATQSNRAKIGTIPLPATLKAWIPSQATSAQIKILTPTPYTLTQTSAYYRQPSTWNSWKQTVPGNVQGTSNIPVTGTFQSTVKPQSLSMTGKAWNRETESSQFSLSLVNNHNQSLPGRPFIPIVAHPFPEQEHTNPTMVSLKPPTMQRRPFMGKTSLPATAPPLPGNNDVKMPTVKHEIQSTNIAEMKIPLFDKTFLPVRPRIISGKMRVQGSIDTNQNTMNQHTVTNKNFVTQQQHVTALPVKQKYSQVTGSLVTQQHVTVNRPVTQQQTESTNRVTQQHFTVNRPVAQQHFTTNQPVAQKHFTVNRPVAQQHFIVNRPVAQQHFTTNQPVAQQQTKSTNPVTQQHFAINTPTIQQETVNGNPVTQHQVITDSHVMQQNISINKPVTLQETVSGTPVTQHELVSGNTVMQPQTVMDNSVAQHHFTVDQSHRQTVKGNNVMQQHFPSNPVTQQVDVKQPTQQGSRNILQLLSKGLNKDLKNLDVRAHLRPYRDAHIGRQNTTKSINMTNIPKTESQQNLKIPEKNSSNTGKSDQFFEMIKTSENKTKNLESEDDFSEHIQPIVISSSSVLDSIATLFAKKKHNQDDKISGFPGTSSGSLSEGPKGSNHDNSFLRKNVTNTSLKAIDRFQSWLKEKAQGTGPNMINNGLHKATSSLQGIKDFNINIDTKAKYTQDVNEINPSSNSTIVQKYPLKKQLDNFQATQNTPGATLRPNLLSTSTSQVNAVTAPNNENTKTTSKRLAKEHLFYFPVKKNTLIDLFKEHRR